MEGVEFTEERVGAPPVAPLVRQSVFVRTLITIGVAKNEAHANIVLIILAVCMIGFAVFLFWDARSQQGIDISSPEYGRLMEGVTQ